MRKWVEGLGTHPLPPLFEGKRGGGGSAFFEREGRGFILNIWNCCFWVYAKDFGFAATAVFLFFAAFALAGGVWAWFNAYQQLAFLVRFYKGYLAWFVVWHFGLVFELLSC